MKKILWLAIFLVLTMGRSAEAQFIVNNGIDIVNSAHLVTNGDWQNDGFIVNNGTIVTSENWINDGVLADTSRGGFVLNYQPSNQFIPRGNGLGYLTINGSSDINVGLHGELVLKDSLALTGGILLISAAPGAPENPGLTLGPGAKVRVKNNAFVHGSMTRSGSGDLLFPLGRHDDNLYLPITLYRVAGSSARVTASIQEAPANYSAGAGVDALINFPYIWTVTKNPSDTAAYVEVNYPNTLPTVANPVIARAVAGSQYASMGARFISNNNGRTTVRSYTRGLKGSFTVAQGFPGSLETDSLAFVALYENTGGSSWTTQPNWQASITTWNLLTVTGQSITAINIPGNNLIGEVPDALVDIAGLQTLNLSNNQLTAIPDFTLNTEITSLDVSGNKLTFASLEPNATVPGFVYTGQDFFGTAKDSLVAVGSPVDFNANAGGLSSVYQWKRNGEPVSGAISSLHAIESISRSTMGEYVAEVTNPLLPDLTLTSLPQNVLAYANITGKLYVQSGVNATNGTMTLFRITSAAYDTIATTSVQGDGAYTFEKVVLDDYQLLGFADTLVHARALPTYYQNTIFWEEADTLFLENNLINLDITSHVEPGATSGQGIISGYLEEDDGTAGRSKETQKVKRVSGSGVSARRVERTGRNKEEILTLVAYTFTDENGEFTLPDLPTGEYRLNIQYPGYPMDETSFTTIFIGQALQSQVSVEARVQNGKIKVRKRIITGFENRQSYHADIYPNPAVDYVHFRFNHDVTGRSISIVDLSGKSHGNVEAESREMIVNVNGLMKGLYIINVLENGATVKSFKLSVE